MLSEKGLREATESPFSELVRERAARSPRKIAFAEAHDPRVRAAIHQVIRLGIAQPVVVGDANDALLRLLPSSVPVMDPQTGNRREEIALHLARRFEGRLDDYQRALDVASTPLGYANGLLALGEVDGLVAGAVYKTADVIRTALAYVGRAPGVKSVSGAFYISPPNARSASDVLTFVDCAVIPTPTVEQLAEMAVLAARDRRAIVGDVPVVAFLSYSTKGSAEGESVDRMRQAALLAASLEPGLVVDGELQADAALIGDICSVKAPGSPVNGRANILVFPNLDAGNIAYKLVQRVARLGAIGPILQGLLRPGNDLSRGVTENDIITVTAVTVLQSTAGSTD